METRFDGNVEIGAERVPWIDLRQVDSHESLYDIIHQCMRESAHECLGKPKPRLIVLATPQPSDALALALAREGIYLVVGPAQASASELLDRLREQLRLIATARNSISASNRRVSGSDSAFSQRPPWFDQEAFDERMRALQQPWHDDDSWKFES